MFSFYKKKLITPLEVKVLKVDLHSHLIPGIDDGSQDIDDSVEILQSLALLGYEKVITTPHIMLDAYGNTKASILKAYSELKEEARNRGIDMEIDIACEYYLDEGFLPLIHKDELLTIDNKYLLFETSYSHRPQELETVIFEILSAGYVPLLAHPERYRYIKQPKDEYATLKNLGVEFQVNINSFNGYYGSSAKENAMFLSKNGMIDFLGSDTHNIKQVENLAVVTKHQVYADIFTNNTIKNDILLSKIDI